MIMKKIVSVLLSIAMVISLAAALCAQNAEHAVVDDPETALSDSAVMAVPPDSGSNEDIAAKEEYIQIGRALVDDLVNDMYDMKGRLKRLEEQLDDVNELNPGVSLTPVETVEGSIYDVKSKTEYGNSAEYGYSFYDVSAGGGEPTFSPPPQRPIPINILLARSMTRWETGYNHSGKQVKQYLRTP